MGTFIISSIIALGVVALVARQLRAKGAPWMPAEAEAQFQRETHHPPRIPFEAAVSIRRYAVPETIVAESQDLAVGGMLLRPSSPLSVGEPISVSFQLPGGAPIEIPAVVCRSVKQSVGIRFDPVDRQRELIADWVENNCTSPR